MIKKYNVSLMQFFGGKIETGRFVNECALSSEMVSNHFRRAVFKGPTKRVRWLQNVSAPVVATRF